MNENSPKKPVTGGKIWYKNSKITRQQILLALLGFAIIGSLVQAAVAITTVFTK